MDKTMRSMNRCGTCGRNLTNPLSVKLGIGPVCRAKDSLQREFDFMRADFEVLKHESGKYIFIRDIGHDVGRSVTNDAEHVTRILFDNYELHESKVFYEDSDGRIDEIVHKGREFMGFRVGHKGVEL